VRGWGWEGCSLHRTYSVVNRWLEDSAQRGRHEGTSQCVAAARLVTFRTKCSHPVSGDLSITHVFASIITAYSAIAIRGLQVVYNLLCPPGQPAAKPEDGTISLRYTMNLAMERWLQAQAHFQEVSRQAGMYGTVDTQMSRTHDGWDEDMWGVAGGGTELLGRATLEC
jgi:hypothetical protein